jgi:hypothetical protein
MLSLHPSPGLFFPLIRLLTLFCVAQVAAGQVVSWSNAMYGMPSPPDGLSGIVALSAGEDHALALREDGTVIAWGKDSSRATLVPAGLTNIIAIASGWNHSVALRAGGTVVAWGLNDWGQTNVPPDLTNVVAIEAGGRHSLALREDGTVVEWPLIREGPNANIPEGLHEVVAIRAGYRFGVALRGDGTVAAWGFDDHGELSIPFAATNIVGISAGADYTLALRSDGEIIDWGGNDRFPRGGSSPFNPKGVAALIAGTLSWHALLENGSVLDWQWIYADRIWQMLTPVVRATNAVSVAANFYGLALIGEGPPRFIERSPRRYGIAGYSTIYLAGRPIGQPPFAYQWQFNGVDIPGANEPRLTLSKPLVAQSGVYTLRAVNSLGSAISHQMIVEMRRARSRANRATRALRQEALPSSRSTSLAQRCGHNGFSTGRTCPTRQTKPSKWKMRIFRGSASTLRA